MHKSIPRKPWKKVLYEHQDYPDNYTDKEIFLRDLLCKAQYISRKEAIFGATSLLEEFCTVVAFVLIYVYLYNEWIRPETILNWSCLLSLLGFIFYSVVYAEGVCKNFGTNFRTVLIFMVFGHLFSPVLHTLTDTISTDTIYTMTFLMLLVHLIFFDYGVGAAFASNSLSLSAVIFASICLASRLASAYHAHMLITVAIECFVLFPLLRAKINNSVFISLGMFCVDAYFLSKTSNLFTVLFLATTFFTNIVCPILFVHYQNFKKNIYGPWDEAVVDDVDKILCN